MSNTQITENFWLSEFACPCCGLGKINYGVIHRLQVIRDFLGGHVKIIIMSGCRCKSHNRSDTVGGKDSSRHLLGWDREKYKHPIGESDAVDFTLSDIRLLPYVNHAFEDAWSGGWHWYEKKKMIHVDLGPKRRWV